MKLFIAIVALIGCLVYAGVVIFVVVPVALTDQNPDTVSREAFAQINVYRADKGLGALVWDDELECLAIAHSQFMNETDTFRHSTHPYAENILQGGFRLEGTAIAEEWKNSPAHYITMVGKSIQRGAVGVAGEYATFMAR